MQRVIRGFLVVALTLTATALFAQQDFSADIVGQRESHPGMTGKLYVTKDKARFESAERNGHSGTVIIDFASQSTIVLIPERKMYVETARQQNPGMQRHEMNFFRPRSAEDACSDWAKLPAHEGGTCKKVGSDTVNGRSTVKYEGTNARGDSGNIWVDSKLAFPIKWQDKNGSGGLENIKEGSQPASLFEIPSDYQKMQFPMGTPNRPNH